MYTWVITDMYVKSNMIFRKLFDTNSMGIFIVDSDYKILSYNETAKELVLSNFHLTMKAGIREIMNDYRVINLIDEAIGG